MKNLLLKFLIPIFILPGCSLLKIPLPDVDPELEKELVQYIENNYMSPEDYVISKFTDHDVVFIGEWHRIKHDPELIQTLIPRLYNVGVYTLGTEFARREDQYLIDSLLNGETYNQKLAEKITFLNFVHWGYKEYVDIYRVAWQFNHKLPEGSRKFRILGLGDSPDWSIVKTKEDWEKDEIRRKVWRGGGEHLWAKVILDEVSRGEKMLVYSGIHHAFTEYHQPIYDFKKHHFIRFETTRMGNYVYDKIGKRAITIFLHSPWDDFDGDIIYPADGIIDAVMRKLPAEYRRVGFDTRGTPFGKLSGETSYYKSGYQDFKLEIFCDGYIYQKPFSEYEGVTPIPDFINEDNIDYARSQSPNPAMRNASIEDFLRGMRNSANIPKRFWRLY